MKLNRQKIDAHKEGVKKPGNQSHFWNTSAHNYQNIQKMRTCFNFFKLQTFLCSLKCAPRSACPSGIVVRSRKKCERPKSGPFSGSFYPKSWFEPVVPWLSSDSVIKTRKEVLWTVPRPTTPGPEEDKERPHESVRTSPMGQTQTSPKRDHGEGPRLRKDGRSVGDDRLCLHGGDLPDHRRNPGKKLRN